MGAQWKQKGRVENSSKKGAVYSKLAREIIVAAKTGDPNPDANFRLRTAIIAAKKASVPKDTIERAIKRGAGLLEKIEYEKILYEGFAPHNVPLIVECLTENRNRTASNVRLLFRKGVLGAIGSVQWMFNHLGVIEATHADPTLNIEDIAIEVGAQDFKALALSEIELDEESEKPQKLAARFITDSDDLDSVSKSLLGHGWTITTSELSYIAKNETELSDDQKKEVIAFLNDLDDDDDVHRIYTALKQ